ncbi:hypothetical protein QYE76_026669 [Lolium multiflorum]|uniref:Uncharacterized protein n=1 Tax=Lolium multiflorum TaxID=4521 RepID=A0AAD8VVE9_LOLMU|nr:hypothetical protein QYE76_026669 [Lolium multiflorum]
MQSFKEFLRTFLNLPSEIVPNMLKKSGKILPKERAMTRPPDSPIVPSASTAGVLAGRHAARRMFHTPARSVVSGARASKKAPSPLGALNGCHASSFTRSATHGEIRAGDRERLAGAADERVPARGDDEVLEEYLVSSG